MKCTNILFSFLTVLFCMFLAGCQGTFQRADPVTVNKTKTVFIVPDDSMVKDCSVEAPPSKAAYLAGDTQSKEDMATTVYRKQTVNVGNCNIQWKELREWYEKQKALYLNPTAK